MDDGYPLQTPSRWFGCVANIVSNEGQYNAQWLQANKSYVFTQTYPPDRTVFPPELTAPEGNNPGSHVSCDVMYAVIMFSVAVVIKEW